MSNRRKREREYFDCPHCGARVEVGATVCRECGSDAETGWSEAANEWQPDGGIGYEADDAFDYDAFIRREFPETSGSPASQPFWNWVLLIVIAMVCIGLLLWI